MNRTLLLSGKMLPCWIIDIIMVFIAPFERLKRIRWPLHKMFLKVVSVGKCIVESSNVIYCFWGPPFPRLFIGCPNCSLGVLCLNWGNQEVIKVYFSVPLYDDFSFFGFELDYVIEANMSRLCGRAVALKLCFLQTQQHSLFIPL